MPPVPKLIDIKEAATRYPIPLATLRYWRQIGYGPKSAKFGRRVFYRLDEFDAWFDSQFDEPAAS
jgi:DNA-binding transcriptional MerR regulator